MADVNEYKFMNENVAVGAPGTVPGGTAVTGSRGTEVAYSFAPGGLATPPAADNPVGSSTAVRNYIDNQKGALGTLQQNTPTIPSIDNVLASNGQDPNTMRDDTYSFYQTQRDQLATRRDEEVKRIAAEFDAAAKAQGTAHGEETAKTTRNLVNLGGYLGDTASNNAFLIKLEEQHRGEVATLVAKRQSAIQTAQNAFSDNDFKLAEAQMKGIRDIDKDIYQRNKDFLDYTLKLREDNRQNLSSQLEEQKFQYSLGQQQREIAKQMVDYFQKQNIQGYPFVEWGGSVFDPTTGQSFGSKEEALAAGVKPDMSNVLPLVQDKTYQSGIIGEYNFYKDEEIAAGRKPLGFNEYQTMDVNRKARIAAAGAPKYYEQKDAAQTAKAQTLGAGLAAVAGPDGFVTPADFKNGLKAWTADGFPADAYYKQFSNFVNPTSVNDKGQSDYGYNFSKKGSLDY